MFSELKFEIVIPLLFFISAFNLAAFASVSVATKVTNEVLDKIIDLEKFLSTVIIPDSQKVS